MEIEAQKAALRNEFFTSTLHMAEKDVSISDATESRGAWPFRAGNPEYWKHKERLIVPGGSVLDLGLGDGRSSVFFAYHGMSVVGIDKNEESVAANYAVSNLLDLESVLGNRFNLEPYVGDAELLDFGDENFDVVVLDDLFLHFTDKERALNILHRGIAAIKPGGHIFVRAITKLDSQFSSLQNERPFLKVNNDVYIDHCQCTGKVELHPHLFFDPHDLLNVVLENKLQIIESLHAPTKGKPNIPHGEDHPVQHLHHPDRRVGFATILAEKPKK